MIKPNTKRFLTTVFAIIFLIASGIVIRDEIYYQLGYYDEYLEDRLIDLYPNVAYKGIISDINAMCNTENIELNKSSSSDTCDYIPFTTIEAEIEIMNMNELEAERLLAIEKLVSSTGMFTLNDLDSIYNYSLSKSSDTWDGIAVGSFIFFGPVAYFAARYLEDSYFRALLCEERAYNKTDELFDGDNSSGQKGDAFKHVYVSMQLRECLGKIMAWGVMVYYEETHVNDFLGDTKMDYHNNKVGRKNNGQYQLFLKDENGFKGTHEDWAERVKSFVDTESNGQYFDWDFTVPYTVDSQNTSRCE
jgi:hypothetical protein